jgi:hypothetical protein
MTLRTEESTFRLAPPLGPIGRVAVHVREAITLTSKRNWASRSGRCVPSMSLHPAQRRHRIPAHIRLNKCQQRGSQTQIQVCGPLSPSAGPAHPPQRFLVCFQLVHALTHRCLTDLSRMRDRPRSRPPRRQVPTASDRRGSPRHLPAMPRLRAHRQGEPAHPGDVPLLAPHRARGHGGCPERSTGRAGPS